MHFFLDHSQQAAEGEGAQNADRPRDQLLQGVRVRALGFEGLRFQGPECVTRGAVQAPHPLSVRVWTRGRAGMEGLSEHKHGDPGGNGWRVCL